MPIPFDQAANTSDAPATPQRRGVSFDAMYNLQHPEKGPGFKDKVTRVGQDVYEEAGRVGRQWTDDTRAAFVDLYEQIRDYNAPEGTNWGLLKKRVNLALSGLDAVARPFGEPAATGILEPLDRQLTVLSESLQTLVPGEKAKRQGPVSRKQIAGTIDAIRQPLEMLVGALAQPVPAEAKVSKLTTGELESVKSRIALHPYSKLPTGPLVPEPPIQPRMKPLPRKPMEPLPPEGPLPPEKEPTAKGKDQPKGAVPDPADIVPGAVRDVARSVTPGGELAQGEVPFEHRAIRNQHDLHLSMAETYAAAVNAGKPVSSKTILGEMIQSTTDPYLRTYMTKLSNALGDIPIYFQRTGADGMFTVETAGGPIREGGRGMGGFFYPKLDRVYIKYQHGTSMTQAVIHELTHGATANFLAKNPNHPLVKELQELANEARARWNRMPEAEQKRFYHPARNTFGFNYEGTTEQEFGGIRARGPGDTKVPYGVMPSGGGKADVQEFVAELFASPHFVNFLAASEKYATAGFTITGANIGTRIQRTLFKMFGLNSPEEQTLLKRALALGEGSMHEQTARGVQFASPSTLESLEAEAAHRRFQGRGESAEALERRQTSRPTDIVGHHIDGTPMQLGEVEDATDGLRAITAREVALDPKHNNAVRKLAGWIDELQAAMAPETRGPGARSTGAIVASAIAGEEQRTMAWRYGSRPRQAFWDSNLKDAGNFIKRFEKGQPQPTPAMTMVDQAYRNWNDLIFRQDQRSGITYTERDNYMAHMFKNDEAFVQWANKRWGRKWYDPAYTKQRGFDLYAQAIAAGFKPLFTNPEDIMLARQHASDVAQARMEIVNDLKSAGLVHPDSAPGRQPWRSPAGETIWVDHEVYQILHNGFDSAGLWGRAGLTGDAYRGLMRVKNGLVQARLSLSLFHPVHLLGIDAADMTALEWGQVLKGGNTKDAFRAVLGTAKHVTGMRTLTDTLWKNPRIGSRIMKAMRGQIPAAQLTTADRQALKWFAEGGFTPEVDQRFRVGALDNMQRAIRQGAYTKGAFLTPFAVLDAMSHPIFQWWIPNLKGAAYLRAVQGAIKANPALLTNDLARMEAFRKIAKSVDNRFGEMAYNKNFWNKNIKDATTLSTLSFGWQLGFFREFGGGTAEAMLAAAKPGQIGRKLKAGELDRALFTMSYMTTALAAGGIMTYVLGGRMPQDWKDYVYPLIGQNADGSDKRVNTPYFTRDAGSTYIHVRNDGPIAGLTSVAKGKASGVFGLIAEQLQGMDSWGREIRQPDAPLLTQVGQSMRAAFADLEPISFEAFTSKTPQERALGFAGFTAAPKYVSQSTTEAHISRDYGQFVSPKATPYERAQFSPDYSAYKKAMQDQDEERAQGALDNLTKKYELTPHEIRNIKRKAERGDDPYVKMFEALGNQSWQRQRDLLDKMTPEERERFLPHSNKQHLRSHYVPPEDREPEE